MTALLRTTACALILASCGSASMTLPTDKVERAATCSVVTAAAARMAVTDVAAPLPLAAHGRVVHHALLAASEGGVYSSEAASAVSRRTNAIKEKITEGEWQDLEVPCRAAYPAAERTEVRLPDDEFEAQLQCSELGEFLYSALKGHESDYRNELVGYRNLHLGLDEKLAPALLRAGSDDEARRAVRHKALAAASALGTPTAVMASCLERFK